MTLNGRELDPAEVSDGIRIQLRPSDSGGTTALVMLPVDVAQGGKNYNSFPQRKAWDTFVTNMWKAYR